MKNNPKIILASNSPRRKTILEKVGYEFEVYPSSVNEDSDEKDPHLFTKTLSQRKAREVSNKFPDHIIIAADTIVFLENNILGKPVTFNDAYKMLEDLSGKKHLVVTGVTVIYKNKQLTFSEEASVFLNKIPKQKIIDYINFAEPYDYAGGYSIEDLPKEHIDEIRGEINTILGLPINKVERYITKINDLQLSSSNYKSKI